jgi:hypothetical protein
MGMWSLLSVSCVHSKEGLVSRLEFKDVKSAYSTWYESFRSDYVAFRKQCAERFRKDKNKPTISEDEVDTAFQHSIVPKSRMTAYLKWIAENSMIDSPYDPGFYSQGSLMVEVLKEAVPAGEGGEYVNQEGTIIFLSLPKVSPQANPYKDNPLPKPGQSARDQYPFVVFKKRGDHLFISSLSSEMGKVIFKLSELQYN